ncbi:MAG TPA: hypothetical protein VK066_27375 [Chloroflexota bacterium]|nr:hypothetical protein [Chloroflexota bacterium]
MSADVHRRAEVLMGEAERKATQGYAEAARALYLAAAQEEARAYEYVPAPRARTRGVIAVSAVALFRRAGALDEAIRYAHRYLEDALPDFARAQLDELLADSQRAQRAPGRFLG